MIESQKIKEALQWRYAVKHFDATKKIYGLDWTTVKDSLLMALSFYGVQPWKFLVVENPEIREKLKAVSWGQSQVTESSHFVVFTYKEKIDEAFVDKYMARTAEVRSLPITALDGFKGMLMENLVKHLQSALLSGLSAKLILLLVLSLRQQHFLKLTALPWKASILPLMTKF